DTDEGISGIGESGLTGRELAVEGAVRQLASLLIGADPTRIEHLWQSMSRGGFFPALGAVAAALSAIDIALWDIRGKALGVPVYDLLGGRTRDRVICYPHCNEFTVEGLLESARAVVAEGWKFVRWGLPPRGETFEPRIAIRTALQQFEALRAEFGDDLELCMDVHTRLDQSDAITLLRAVEPYRPFFMEDPVRSEDLTALRRVRQQTAVPIAAGEQLHSKWQFRQIIEEELIDYARIDLCLAGGFTEAKKIAAMAEAHHIKLATHNPLGPVSTAACLHLNLACPNVGVQEQPRRPGALLTDLFPVQMDWEDGYLLPPTRPGLGIEFDRALARAHPFQMTGLPNLRRADGSFTNW
ncbi:MAG: mandelate racemase/muconate lactonizing enzyme family protein, partial [Dehalococcoidia bacterium]